jgi:hypothetical protein
MLLKHVKYNRPDLYRAKIKGYEEIKNLIIVNTN